MLRLRFVPILVLIFMNLSCATTTESTRNLQGSKGVGSETVANRPFFPDCQPFESIDFGSFSVSRLRGVTLFENQGEVRSLTRVQIAAQPAGEEKVLYVLSDMEGRFNMSNLSPGVYDVWTCKQGFDEVQFHITLAPGNEDSKLMVFMGLAEGDGRRDVVVSR